MTPQNDLYSRHMLSVSNRLADLQLRLDNLSIQVAEIKEATVLSSDEEWQDDTDARMAEGAGSGSDTEDLDEPGFQTASELFASSSSVPASKRPKSSDD